MLLIVLSPVRRCSLAARQLDDPRFKRRYMKADTVLLAADAAVQVRDAVRVGDDEDGSPQPEQADSEGSAGSSPEAMRGCRHDVFAACIQ